MLYHVFPRERDFEGLKVRRKTVHRCGARRRPGTSEGHLDISICAANSPRAYALEGVVDATKKKELRISKSVQQKSGTSIDQGILLLSTQQAVCNGAIAGHERDFIQACYSLSLRRKAHYS